MGKITYFLLLIKMKRREALAVMSDLSAFPIVILMKTTAMADDLPLLSFSVGRTVKLEIELIDVVFAKDGGWASFSTF
jgi:hypothetical protein